MRINKFLLGLLIVVILTSFTNSSLTLINGNSLDSSKLEQLILEKVNKLRKSKRLSELTLNSILELASQDHANYLKKIKKLTHEQPRLTKKTPLKRTKYYKGKFSYVGENIAYTFLNRSVKQTWKKNKNTIVLTTYEKTAEFFFQLWKNSPSHYKNLIDKDFDLTSIRFSYDPVKKRIYGVQVFGAL